MPRSTAAAAPPNQLLVQLPGNVDDSDRYGASHQAGDNDDRPEEIQNDFKHGGTLEGLSQARTGVPAQKPAMRWANSSIGSTSGAFLSKAAAGISEAAASTGS